MISTRPILLIAVKRAVAERFIHPCSWDLEQQPQFNHVDACSKAARRNIRLAQWAMQLYNKRRLLQAGVHFVPNAAVIFLLKCVLREDPGASDDIAFAIDIFARQSRTGTNYKRDCWQVLKDLKALIDQFLARSLSTQQNYASNMPDTSTNSSNNTINTHLDVVQDRDSLMHDGGSVYHELMTWMQDDNS